MNNAPEKKAVIVIPVKQMNIKAMLILRVEKIARATGLIIIKERKQ